jgi:hypothetical protein
VDQVMAKLPESIRKTAPDYAAIRTQLLQGARAAATKGPGEETKAEGEVTMDESITVTPEAAPAPAPDNTAPAPAPAPDPAPTPAPTAP